MSSIQRLDALLKEMKRVGRSGAIPTAMVRAAPEKVIDELQRRLNTVYHGVEELIRTARQQPNFAGGDERSKVPLSYNQGVPAEHSTEFVLDAKKHYKLDRGGDTSGNAWEYIFLIEVEHNLGFLVGRWAATRVTSDNGISNHLGMQGWGTWRVLVEDEQKTVFQVDYDFIRLNARVHLIAYSPSPPSVGYDPSESAAGGGAGSLEAVSGDVGGGLVYDTGATHYYYQDPMPDPTNEGDLWLTRTVEAA